jgi:Ribbon-helix-helix protein
MDFKTARLTLLIDPNKKEAFERLCALQDRSASQVVRQLTRDYLARHGVHYTTRDVTAWERDPSSDIRAQRTKSGSPDAAPHPPNGALRTPRPPES